MDHGNDRTLLLYIYRYKNIFESLCDSSLMFLLLFFFASGHKRQISYQSRKNGGSNNCNVQPTHLLLQR